MRKILITLAALLLTSPAFGFGPGSSFDDNDVYLNEYGLVLHEQPADPTAPGSNEIQLYAKDNGSGTTNLYTQDSAPAVLKIMTGASAGLSGVQTQETGKSIITTTDGIVTAITDKFDDNLTFYVNYEDKPVGEITSANLAADFSVGDRTATFTWSTTNSTRTYVDGSGNIQLADTVNTGRIQGGAYDATGFHTVDANGKSLRGLMIERASTNLILDSYFANGTTTYWAAEANVTVTNSATYANPYGGGNVQKVVAATDGLKGIVTTVENSPSVTSGQKYTVSYLARGAGTLVTYFTRSASASGANHVLTDSWQFFQDTFTANSTGTSAVYIEVATANTFYLAFVQQENLPYATSFIPTTTAALTRNAESLSYLTAGNRTAATESIFIKFAPESTFANDGLKRGLCDTDTKERYILKNTAATVVKIYPNATDSAGSTVDATTTILANTSYVYAATMASTGDPNCTVYINGTSEGSTNTDFTANAFGTNFYIGAVLDAQMKLDGIIQAVTIHSDVMTGPEVLAEETKLAA